MKCSASHSAEEELPDAQFVFFAEQDSVAYPVCTTHADAVTRAANVDGELRRIGKNDDTTATPG